MLLACFKQLFWKYLEQLASVQYLLSRGYFGVSDGVAFSLGAIAARSVPILHFGALALCADVGISYCAPLQPVRGILISAIGGIGLATALFADSNLEYLCNLRDRIKAETPEAGRERERAALSLIRDAVIVFVLALLMFGYTHATAA